METDYRNAAETRTGVGERTRGRQRGPEPNTDIAALGGGVVAIAMTIFGDDGPYDLFGVAIAVTLLLLIAGYVLPHPRDGWKRIAVAAVVGLVSAPISGYTLEHQSGPWTICSEWNYRIAWDQANRSPPFDLRPARCDNELSILQARGRIIDSRGREPPSSTVSDKATLEAWLLIASLFWVVDLLFAWRRRKLPSSTTGE